MVTLIRMSSKGQLVVPQDVRENLGLKPGDAFVGIQTPDGVLFRKFYDAERFEEHFRRVSGKIAARHKSLGIKTNEINKEIAWLRASSSTPTSSSRRQVGKERRTK